MQQNYWVIEREFVNSQNKQIANEYLENLKQRGLNERTIINYKRTIENLLLNQSKEIADLESAEIKKWIEQQYGHQSGRTVNHVISVIKNFFVFCQEEGYLKAIPMKRHWKRRIHKTYPNYLSTYELARFQLQFPKLPLRSRVIIEFLLSTGCRSRELCKLDVDDIASEERRAIIRNGGRSRVVFFSETVAILLKEYLKTHPKNENALFINRIGKRINSDVIARIIKRLIKMAELQKPLSCSSLRHTYALQICARDPRGYLNLTMPTIRYLVEAGKLNLKNIMPR